MDPDETLRQIVALADKILRDTHSDPDAIDLAEHAMSLHEWICKGGFLPEEWKHEKD